MLDKPCYTSVTFQNGSYQIFGNYDYSNYTQNIECGGIGNGYYCHHAQMETGLTSYNAVYLAGSCQKTDYTILQISGIGTLYKSSQKMIWESAKNYCKSLGKDLLSAANFYCYPGSNSNTYYNCSNNYLTELSNKVGNFEFWLNDFSSSWHMRTISVIGEIATASQGHHNRDEYYALCR